MTTVPVPSDAGEATTDAHAARAKLVAWWGETCAVLEAIQSSAFRGFLDAVPQTGGAA